MPELMHVGSLIVDDIQVRVRIALAYTQHTHALFSVLV